MEVHIGFDISLQTTHVCVVDSEGKTMREGVAASDVDALSTWLRTQCNDWTIKRIVFETGHPLQRRFVNIRINAHLRSA